MPSLLVLGGTDFVGPALVEVGRTEGWQVTVFNRGTRPAPAGVSVLRGDRTVPADLQQLAAGTWDVVADTWSGAPRDVAAAASLLADRAETYLYVSSESVYRWPLTPDGDESEGTVDGDPDAGATDYAADKRGGELAAERAFGPDRVVLLRAGLVLGPRENVGRLPWWLRRVARGGTLVAPGPAGAPLQYVDARDLAAFALRVAVHGPRGPFNVTSRTGHATMGQLLDACLAAVDTDAELCWVDPQFLLDHQVAPWTELPIWLPPDHPLFQTSVERAYAAGLACRPVEQTVADTWQWLRPLPADAARGRPEHPVGLDPETERSLLYAWTERGGGS